jgi:hypothetical protein
MIPDLGPHILPGPEPERPHEESCQMARGFCPRRTSRDAPAGSAASHHGP